MISVRIDPLELVSSFSYSHITISLIVECCDNEAVSSAVLDDHQPQHFASQAKHPNKDNTLFTFTIDKTRVFSLCLQPQQFTMSPFTVSIPAIHCSPLLQPPYFLTPPPSSTESSPSSATSPCLSDHSSIPRFKSPTMAGPPIKSFTQKMLEPVARPRSKPVKYAPFAVSTPEITAQERQLLIHKLAKYRVQQYSDGDRAIDDLHYSVPYSGEKSKPTLAEMTGKKQLDCDSTINRTISMPLTITSLCLHIRHARCSSHPLGHHVGLRDWSSAHKVRLQGS